MGGNQGAAWVHREKNQKPARLCAKPRWKTDLESREDMIDSFCSASVTELIPSMGLPEEPELFSGL